MADMGGVAACELEEYLLEREVRIFEREQRPALAGEKRKEVAAQVVAGLRLDRDLEHARLLFAERIDLLDVLERANSRHHIVFRTLDAGDQAVLRGEVVRKGVGCAVGHKAAVVDDDHAFADRLHLGQNVRGENDRVAFAEALDQVADLDNLLRVKADGRLVQNEDGRVAEQRLRDADALLVAL